MESKMVSFIAILAISEVENFSVAQPWWATLFRKLVTLMSGFRIPNVWLLYTKNHELCEQFSHDLRTPPSWITYTKNECFLFRLFTLSESAYFNGEILSIQKFKKGPSAKFSSRENIHLRSDLKKKRRKKSFISSENNEQSFFKRGKMRKLHEIFVNNYLVPRVSSLF